MRTVKLYFYGLLVLLFVVFIVQNYSTLTYSVSLRLNLGFLALESVPLPFFLIAPLVFFAGVLLATLIGLVERRRLSKELKQTKMALRDSEPRTPMPEASSPRAPVSSETENPPSEEKPPTQP
jgi:uncharacterized integral membrane protein